LRLKLSYFSFTAIRQSKTLRTIALFATGNMAAMALGLLGSVVQARYVGPDEMGLLRIFGMLTGYLTFLHLGVFDGLHREIPLLLGRGEQKKAEYVAATCLPWIILVSLFGTVLFLGLAVQAAYYRAWMQFWGWLAFIPGIIVVFYGGYLTATFRTGRQFVQLSNAGVLQAIAGTFLLPLFPLLGYYCACLRAAISGIVNLFFLHHWRPFRIEPRRDIQSFRETIRIGLPLSGIGYLATSLWLSIESNLVLVWFGQSALGIYAVAVLIRTIVGQLAQNINQVLGTKICERYGRSNDAQEAVHGMVAPVLFAAIASLPLIAIGWILMPWMVELLIPRYRESISLMQIFLFIMPVQLLAIPSAVLWAAFKLFDSLVSVLAGLVSFAAFAYYFRSAALGMTGMAYAYMLGQIVYMGFLGFFSMKLCRRDPSIRAPQAGEMPVWEDTDIQNSL
jgi:O-antigen/teichoic acid export membrane protein